MDAFAPECDDFSIATRRCRVCKEASRTRQLRDLRPVGGLFDGCGSHARISGLVYDFLILQRAASCYGHTI